LGRVKKSLTQVDSEPSQEVDTKYSGWTRMLVPKPDPAVSLLKSEKSKKLFAKEKNERECKIRKKKKQT